MDIKVGELLFSEGTYQVEVKEGRIKTPFWPFLQLDDTGKILDQFCSCEVKSCPHITAAYQKIMGGKKEPLHVRFRESFWNQLCQIAARRHGYDVSCLKKNLTATSTTGKLLFSVRGLNERGKKKLKALLFERAKETEETSIKFSNLSAEELKLWKEGRPSPHLCYELSFWSDLAKWWMLHDEYEITFTYEKNLLPNWVAIRFKDVECGFYIAEANWPQIIPSLKTVDSPLQLFELPFETIKKITYDPEKEAFFVISKSVIQKEPKMDLIAIGEWLYIPKIGFYPAQVDPLLQEKIIPKEKIAQLLQKHAKLIKTHLVGCDMHLDPIRANYHLFIDKDASLHIDCYVFERGDIASYFGPWVFVKNKGFYLLENLLFGAVKSVIAKEKMSDFINQHRHFLQGFEGFQTHLSILETQLSFSLTASRHLQFESKWEITEEMGEVIDYGEWLYIKNKGFYSKISKTTQMLQSGILVPPQEISRFIHAHREELEQVKGFFSSKCPLEKSGLHISLNEKGQIHIRPEYVPAIPFEIFGDFIYVEKEGFSEIPSHLRLPDPYTKEMVVDSTLEPYFVAFELEILRPFILYLDNRLTKPKKLILHIKAIKKDEKSKAGKWIVDLEYETEIGKLPVIDIYRAQNKRYLFSNAGLIFLKNPRFNWLKSVNKKRWLKKGAQVRLSTLEWMRLLILEEIREPDDKKSLELLEVLQQFKTKEPLILDGLKSDLRPYQFTGVQWLFFLYCNGLSGLLCDEMGLGKTHQAMALIAASYNTVKAKYLVICPTSVIYHWEELLKRFFPKLTVGVYYGVQRQMQECDLLLTSYGVLRSEKKELAKIPFEIAIFDEVQIAKNPHSQTHKALRLLDAKMRLGLTGTPIENRLLELKALFDIILPTYMPTETAFKELFVNPIEKNHDPDKKMLLARFIKPFVLRRKKSEVLLELPEKTEEIAYCDLSEEQKLLYRKTFLQNRDTLLKELENEKAPPPITHIFSLLSRLKQICDHPCLINKKFDEYQKHHSGKWDLFVELLQETRESGQKLVVFSQYLDMLDIIERYLKEKGIGYAGIRGSTRDRKAELERFRDDPQCEVFVASLQAAGVGIELTAASVVIHYDRWWNPAKENQATDRVHRIGQSRGVQVFKMVTKGTIEEHIHRLIEKKLTLLEGIIGFDDQDQIKGLDRKELLHLLQLVNENL